MHQFHTALEHSKVDRANGVIHGVSIITAGIQARGHDLEVDAKTLSQMKECADAMGTVSVKWNHKSGADAVAGYLKNFWIEGNKLKGDWHLLKSHGQFEQAIELAERMPKNVGLSAAFLGDDEIRKDGQETKTFARCSELLSVDLVAQPAANPDGMFEARLDGKNEPSVDTQPNHQMANQDPSKQGAAAPEPTLADVMAAITGLTQRIEAQEGTISQITDHLSQGQPGLTVEEALKLSREEIQDLLDRGLIDEADANEIVSMQNEALANGEGGEGAPEGEGAPGEGSESAPATATALSRLSRQVKELSARFERDDKDRENAEIEHQFSTIEKNMETLATENEALRFALKTGGARAVTPAVSVRMFEGKADKKHEFEALVADKVTGGKTKAEAVRLSAKEAPGLYQDYLAGRGIIRMDRE